MVYYESDFYTTRRPYRSTTPSYSSYVTSLTPTRQIRILPGLGKVHIVHSYDRIVPYVGHKKLTVVTLPPKIYSTRPSVLQRELDWIENKIRPWVSYSPTNHYLNSDSAVRISYIRDPINYYTDNLRLYNNYKIIRINNLTNDYLNYYSWPYYLAKTHYPLYRTISYLDDIPMYRSLRLQRTFDDESRQIRAQADSLLRMIHTHVPRIRHSPLTAINRYGDVPSLPARYSNDSYIHKLLTVSPVNNRIEYATYYTEPVKKYIGKGHLSCVLYAGGKSYDRRTQLASPFDDVVKNDIQLLSYYISKFRQDKGEPTKESIKAEKTEEMGKTEITEITE